MRYFVCFRCSVPLRAVNPLRQLRFALRAFTRFSSDLTSPHFDSLLLISSSLTSGKEFYQFAKSAAWGKDLWDDLVSPYFDTPLSVETWRDGSGGRMSSMCGPNSTMVRRRRWKGGVEMDCGCLVEIRVE